VTEVIAQQLATPEEFAGRIFESAVGGMEVLSLYLGEKLGYYKALASGPLTAAELASKTGTHERYTREWLEQQATAQILRIEGVGTAAPRFSLPEGYEAVLVDELSPAYMAPIGRFLKIMGAVAESLLDAYRSGGGVSWAQMGPDARESQAAFNRPFFAGSLAEYLRQIPEVDAALVKPGATVAEIGCGGGFALIAMAQAYPQIKADGFDIDEPTTVMARTNVRAAGLEDRISVHCRDAGDSALAGSYDLVAAFECVHDMPDPASVLSAMKRLVKPGGTVLIMDERVGDEFGAFGDLTERLFYGASLFICLPDGMSTKPSVATGTVMRAPTLKRYALEAGFRDAEVLPLEHGMFRFYRLVA
jgi:SAM-dependent methyltransferase